MLLALLLTAPVAIGGWLAFRSFRPSPLPEPEPWTGSLPVAAPPDGMALFQLPTGTYESPALLSYRGGSARGKRQFAATAALIQHPEGDLLIDAGFGAGVEDHLALLPTFQRTPHSPGATARRQLADVGYDFGRLAGVLITHAHWDHVSGIDSLDVPVWISVDELPYVERSKGASVFRLVTRDRPIRELAIDGPPYLGFDRSCDVYGDGSIVVVPVGGHTDGSIIVFVTVPDGTRYAFIGDLTWQCEGLSQRAERPFLMRRVADVDAGKVRSGLLGVIALGGEYHVIPSHDQRAFDVLPRPTAGAIQ